MDFLGCTACSAMSSGALCSHEEAFISIWNTLNVSPGSSYKNQIVLPLCSYGSYNFEIDWGDGFIDKISSWNSLKKLHSYKTSGTYTIKILGTIRGFRFANHGDKLKLLKIEKWGCLRLETNNGRHFEGCSNLCSLATDSLILDNITSLSRMFNGCISLCGNNSIPKWNVSKIRDTSRMFKRCQSFDCDLSDWNVSSLEHVDCMLEHTSISKKHYNLLCQKWPLDLVEKLKYKQG